MNKQKQKGKCTTDFSFASEPLNLQDEKEKTVVPTC